MFNIHFNFMAYTQCPYQYLKKKKKEEKKNLDRNVPFDCRKKRRIRLSFEMDAKRNVE